MWTLCRPDNLLPSLLPCGIVSVMIIGPGYVKYKKLTGSNIWVNIFSPKALRRPSGIDHARKTVYLHMLNNILTIFLWLFCTTPLSSSPPVSRRNRRSFRPRHQEPLIQYMLCARRVCTLSAFSIAGREQGPAATAGKSKAPLYNKSLSRLGQAFCFFFLFSDTALGAAYKISM